MMAMDNPTLVNIELLTRSIKYHSLVVVVSLLAVATA